ncbi:Na+:solute symporter [Xanthomonas bundabergensis]|uniref:Na+:solute symporter n=1 Tax=Xanthomonas bundabergensis TaxID=3160842 RepID=UPI0035152A69
MLINRGLAVTYGLVAILGVVALQAFNSVACYQHGFREFLAALGMFLLVPLLAPVIALATANPLRAVGGCLLFAPWLGLAYYTDCVRPYTGGGASMVYVAVLFWGTPSAILGVLVTGPITRMLGISVAGPGAKAS